MISNLQTHMIQRELRDIIQKRASQMPVISVTGPRQSGKTTLTRQAFPNHKYINLENISDRIFATEDPEGFIHSCKDGAILDEVQNVPGLFSGSDQGHPAFDWLNVES